MIIRCSVRGLRLAAGLVATGVVAAFVLPATSAVAALHGPRSQHGPAPVAQAPLPRLAASPVLHGEVVRPQRTIKSGG